MGNKEPVIFQIGWNACINCGACVAVCPKEAGFISAFDTIAVQEPCDIACMVCEDICPVSTISHIQLSDWQGPDPKYALNSSVSMKSAPGISTGNGAILNA